MKPSDVLVLVPNLKRRLSGVTTTIVRLVPLQASLIALAATGPGLPDHLPHISVTRVLFLPRKQKRVWHARRNNEMLLGVVLKYVLRKNIRLVFTSSAQRDRTRYSMWLIRKMDVVVSTSSKGLKKLKVPAKVVMHGVDTSFFAPPENRGDLRVQLGLPKGKIVGCFGRNRFLKGTDVFVDVMLRTLPNHPETTAIIMGRTTPQNQKFVADLTAKIAAQGLSDRLKFVPEVPVDQVSNWYQALDIFVAPSRYEGFGLTPLEAMSCGVPVVTTNVGVFEELIAQGKTGTVVPLGDVEKMSAAIDALLNDDKKRLRWAKAARKHTVANFQIQNEAQSLIAIYRELLR